MTHTKLVAPQTGDWIAISEGTLPADAATTWAIRPECGAVVTFCGTVRGHSEGRPGVTGLEYEAYEEQMVPRMTDVANQARAQWPEVGNLVLWHRVGKLQVGETAVVVAAATPHRAEAFAVAQFCIDTIKHTVPIWKLEHWDGGSDWSVCSDGIA